MSHVSKVEFLREAQIQGFKTYLYFVSTVDPDINIARVNYRVSMGGMLYHIKKFEIDITVV